MPVKIWNREGGTLTSRVETSRNESYRGERYRTDADALDLEIDRMLDRAVELSAAVQAGEVDEKVFIRRWAVGRALGESGVLQSEHLEPSERNKLWLAIARKCRLGVRSDGSPEERWRELIPNREHDPSRIENDVFALGLWLQEQEIESAMISFGASPANAREIHRRGAINSKNMRDALARWFTELDPRQRLELRKHGKFVLLAKALVARFPARGPGSAKRPVHYPDEELYQEVRKVLDRVAAELSESEGSVLSRL